MRQLPYTYLLLLLFIHTPIACSQQQSSLAQLYKKLHSSVVILNMVSNTQTEQQDKHGNYIVKTIKHSEIGSGFLIADDLILTAAHVVHGSQKINAVFFDGVEITGHVISSDMSTDLSLIRLDKKHPVFGPLVLGDSDQMNIGDPVFIIGAPYNISYSLSRGILSGRHQEGFESDFKKSEFFQTDATLNPGNSGGPVFNMQGQVIAVASFIKTQSGGFEGLGFAVTINSARRNLIDQPRFYSGITHHYIDGNLAKALNVPQAGGVLVQNVVEDSIAGRLGIKGGIIEIIYHNQAMLIGGDIIVKIDAIPLDSQENYHSIEKNLLTLGNNKKHSLTLLRQGKLITKTWQ